MTELDPFDEFQRGWDSAMQQIAAVSDSLGAKPDFRWATVTSVAPLAIRLDGDTDPLSGSPATLIPTLLVGERVMVMMQSRRATIVGRSGTAVRRTGRLSVSTGTLTQVGTSGVYTATVPFTVPAVAPPGCLIRIDAVAVGNGWGWFSQVSQVPGVSTTACSGRFMQVGNSQAQSPSLVWEIVPVGT